ncbi:unnamed protein product, partial [Prunus brigantina]
MGSPQEELGTHEFMEDTNENNSDLFFNPQVEDHHVPKIGQEFESLEDAYNFYNNYAKQAGFSVRSYCQQKSKTSKEILRKEYVCYKEGVYSKEVSNESERRRGVVRSGCKAKIAFLKVREGTKYIISNFVEGHNHALTAPQMVHLLRSHRKISEVNKALAQRFGDVNIPTHQQFSLLEVQAGGMQNIGYTKKDLYNYKRQLQRKMKGHDAQMLSEHFIGEQAKNESFFFMIEADDDDRLKHCFWADPTSRRAYKFYGDVVVFDTTYNTNRYGMVFAPLVGVNNHGQTILFGCGFLSNETTESFLWLFEQFKKAMPAGPPKIIITDQDPAMGNAISQAFPSVFHRYCIWHILDKFSQKINTCIYKDENRELQSCVWESDTKEEFESKWMDVVNKGKLNDDEWLSSIYRIRSRWVPAYVKDIFSAGMSSSQRVEGVHAFFKLYISKRNSLMDFILRFNRALAQQRHEEIIADHVDINEQPMLKSPLIMEKQMATIYTRKIFYKFQKELWKCLACVLQLAREDDNLCFYKVMERKKDGSFMHVLAYMKMKQIEYLSNKYILNRWTRAAKSEIVVEEGGRQITESGDNSLLMRQTRLSKLAFELIDGALASQEASKVLLESFEGMREKLNFVVRSSNNICGGNDENATRSYLSPHLNDPLQVRAKG